MPDFFLDPAAIPLPSRFNKKAIVLLHSVGGATLATQMIAVFLPYAARKIEEAHHALATRNEVAIHAAAHAIKASAGQLGAVRLQQLCMEAEEKSLPELALFPETAAIELRHAAQWFQSVEVAGIYEREWLSL